MSTPLAWFFSLSLFAHMALVYLFCLNAAAFFFFGLDKFKSTQGSRRIRERTLWGLMLLGGSLGAFCAMSLFRHKTKKQSFQSVAFLILLLQAALIFFAVDFLSFQN